MTIAIRPFVRAVVLLVLACGCIAPASADVVKLKDGRSFEGEILSRNDSGLKIDTMVAGFRTTMKIAAEEIESVVEQDVPGGFFERKAPPLPKSEGVKHEGTPYLHVPIKGQLGKDVLPEGLEQSLQFVARMGIEHVVITVDSSGGDVAAARDIRDILQKYDERLKTHCIVTQATGVAMVLPVHCDHVYVAPESVMGGIDLSAMALEKEESDSDEVAMDIAAARAAGIAQQKGIPGQVVLALLLPKEKVAVWEDENGKQKVGLHLPGDVPAERVILDDHGGSPLVINGAQAVALRLAEELKGGAAELGSKLGLAGWAPYSNFGESAMKTALRRVEEGEKREEQKATMKQRKIEENVKRFEEAMQYVWANFKEYERYEPGGGKYSTHQGYGRRNRYYYGSYDTNYLTKDSRKDWRNRTDMATGALYRLRSGLIELYRLDRDGKKLGIERDSQARFKEFLKGAAGKEVEYSPRAIYDWAGREIARLEAGRSRKYR